MVDFQNNEDSNKIPFPGQTGPLPLPDNRIGSIDISSDGLILKEANQKGVTDGFYEIRTELLKDLDELIENFADSNLRPLNYSTVSRFRDVMKKAADNPDQIRIGTLGNSMRSFYVSFRDDYEQLSDVQQATLSSIGTKFDLLEATMPSWRALMLEIETIRTSREDAKLVSTALRDTAEVLEEAADLVSPRIIDNLAEVTSIEQVTSTDKGGFAAYQAITYNNLIVSLFRIVSDDSKKDNWIAKQVTSRIISKTSFKRMVAAFPSVFGWVRAGLEHIIKFIRK